MIPAPIPIEERERLAALLRRVSHELRAPLHATLGLAEALLEEPAEPLTARQRERIAMILDSANQLHELVNDILDGSRIELEMLRLHCTLTDVQAICDRSLAMVFDAAEQKQIRLCRQYGSGEQQLMVDRKRLTQILVNLLDHAVKHTAPGGQVELGFQHSSSAVEFLISDSGIGIADAEHRRDWHRAADYFAHRQVPSGQRIAEAGRRLAQ